jgi:hypothetical protein
MPPSFDFMWDSIHGSGQDIPTQAGKVAGYVCGDVSYVWSPADWARFPVARQVRIDARGTCPFASDVLDVETGACSLTGARLWATRRTEAQLWSVIYISAGALPALRAVLAGIPRVLYWVANWDLTEAQAVAMLAGDVVAVQFEADAEHDLSVVAKTAWGIEAPTGV